MSAQYGYDDDLFDNADDDTDNDLSSDVSQIRQSPANQQSARTNGKRRLRIRPMSPTMMEKHPEVVTILLTRSNGQQLIFVRK
jgi:hypothetical protein